MKHNSSIFEPFAGCVITQEMRMQTNIYEAIRLTPYTKQQNRGHLTKFFKNKTPEAEICRVTELLDTCKLELHQVKQNW